MVLEACGPLDAGSSETPKRLDNVVLLRKPWCTSACRESAQKPSSSLRYSGAYTYHQIADHLAYAVGLIVKTED